MSTGNNTLDRIQQEIQEALQREEELREKYSVINNNHNGEYENHHVNGYSNGTTSPEPIHITNNNEIMKPPPGKATTMRNTSRIFTTNPTTSKGIMHKFIKSRGKIASVNMRPSGPIPTDFISFDFQPAKVTVEPGKTIRNGFVSAEEKMKKELQEFQTREEELRKERRKSQPSLMAALEEEESNLRPAKTTAALYSNEDLTSEYSEPPSLKRAKSLAELCDASDDELDAPGTYSLIKQFESLKSHS